jgi:hypothetical protein
MTGVTKRSESRTSSGERLAPEIYAEVYKALDSYRTTQPSKGFMTKATRDSLCIGAIPSGAETPPPDFRGTSNDRRAAR